MIKRACNYKTIKHSIKIPTSFFTPIMSDRREIGLQIADFQERKQLYKEKQERRTESIKNVIWLG
tara:strand:+ start:2918 stop:3112 length:195 start_codon:yes stop_codon:yes gene_type:complete